MHRLVCCTAIAIALTTSVRAARAQSADAGAAEALFQSGKTLLEQKNYAQACPKLAESYRLDPGTGTLLALALCHEGEGRLASAWGEFADAAARSRREGRPDREALARQHMTALESRLPMLTISVAPGADKIDRLEIKRDGLVVGSGSWATPVPVDPGHHHVEATAPGYKPFSATVTLAIDAARETVVVPPLERAPDLPEQTAGDVHAGFWSPLRYVGLAVAGVGVAGLGVGTVFGLQAISRNNDSKADCDAQSVCGPAGTVARHDAQSAGNVSTVAFLAGGVLLAGGATMFVLAKPRSSNGSGTAVRATPLVSNREVGIGFEGAF
jgi:hypothetical protein